jgi:guanylate kinase
VSGPSGAGKSSVVSGLKERLPFSFSVSMTTRPARPGEADGVDYHFVTPEEFAGARDRGDLAEWAEYGGHWYGTPAPPLDAARDHGTDVLLDIEIIGAGLIKERFPDAIMIWIEAPDVEELERRLRGRGDTSEADVERRLALAREHSRMARDLFDHFVVNDELDVAIGTVTDILAAVPPPPEAP